MLQDITGTVHVIDSNRKTNAYSRSTLFLRYLSSDDDN